MSNNSGVIKDIPPEAAKSLEASLVSLVDGSQSRGGHADQEVCKWVPWSLSSLPLTPVGDVNSGRYPCRCHSYHRTQQVPRMDIKVLAVRGDRGQGESETVTALPIVDRRVYPALCIRAYG